MTNDERRLLARVRYHLEITGGIHTEREQAKALSSWCGVSERTAKRWLQYKAFPRSWMYLVHKVVEGLGIPGHHLFEDEPCPGAYAFAQRCREMSPESRQRMGRLLIRLNNDSPMAKRMVDLFSAGQVGAHDVLSVGGR